MHYFLHYLVPGDAVAPSSVRWRTESGLFVTYLSGRSVHVALGAFRSDKSAAPMEQPNVSAPA